MVEITRREFVKSTVVVAGTTAGILPAKRALALDILAPGELVQQALPVEVLRPEDLLKLRFDFVNLNLQTIVRPDGGVYHSLVPVPNQQAFIVVEFPPQSIAEEAFDESLPMKDPPVQNRISGNTRLAFIVPPTEEIPYTLEELLRFCRTTSMNINKDIHEPNPEDNDTFIEMPYRLFLTPEQSAGWVHSDKPVYHLDPVTGEKIYELWHTRFEDVNNPTVRAIWSQDYLPAGSPPPNPFTMSLRSSERNAIVHLTSSTKDYVRPVQVERLMLTSLGAWMKTEGAWPENPDFSLLSWIHRATMGRDHYVKVVHAGYLFPFMHRASIITITERKFVKINGNNVAYLIQYSFIVVREPEKVYPWESDSMKDVNGRKLPFKRIRITTLITPHLSPAPTEADAPFWPQVGGKDFLFHLIAEDWDGQRSEFTAPLKWIPNIYDWSGDPDNVLGNYSTDTSKNQHEMQGQKVAFAESNKPGDTSLETDKIMFGAIKLSSSPSGEPGFYPIVSMADVRLAALEQVAGKQAQPQPIQLYRKYYESSYDASENKGKVFVELIDANTLLNPGDEGYDPSFPRKKPNPMPLLKFPADRSGGAVTPNMNVGALSQEFGVVGGLADDFNALATGTLSIAATDTFFEKFFSDAKILGGIALGKVIDNTWGDGKNIPKLTTRVVYKKGGDGKENPNLGPEAIETKLEWHPTVKYETILIADDNTTLDIVATLLTPLDGTEPTYDIKGELKNFQIDLFGHAGTSFIILTFNSFNFSAASKKKMDVNVDLKDFVFAGPLTFVQTLKEAIPLDLFKDPPSLDITAEGINLGYTLGIPSVGIGVFSLSNINLSAALNIPFIGDPVRLRFAFSERQNPFNISVSMFAGGGFFGLALGLDGVEMIEASLEFGGKLSLDIGVASGGVYVMAGIYFKYEEKDDTKAIILTGYLRCGGNLEVLGIISISVTFYMGLTYQDNPRRIWGQASLTVEVEILFFSVSVTLTVEREFAASPPPTFADLMGNDDWKDYCEAFAPLEVTP